MPTIRGWAALGAALALAVLWVGFGEAMLLGVAAFLSLGVALGSIYVRRSVPRVAARRAITPIQVHDGDRAVVELEISTSKRVAQIVVEDTVHGLGSARFFADRVRAHNPVVARYEVLSRPRGIYRVGPAIVTVRDPLAMAESGGTTGRVDRLVVYPSVEDLSGLPIVRGHDPTVHRARSSFSPTGGDDFYTLREYEQGDDLRRVHWPSSAKRDTLMIKQLETPWQSRALVLLNPRTSSYSTAESFEHAVRGAASAMRHLFSNGFNPTMWMGDYPGTTVTTPDTYAMAMESLAAAGTRQMLSLPAMVDRLMRGGVTGGALVLVTGEPDHEDVAAHGILGKDYLRTIVMSVAHGENEAILNMQRVGAIPVVASPGASWAPAWREAMEQAWSTATAG